MAAQTAGKVLTLSQATRWATTARRRGHRLVATNGCFDLLHFGHVHYLQRARKLGDLLVVGLNADRSVRQLKGPTRPLVPEHERATLLAALRCVDAVVIFPQKRADNFIAAIKPHVYVKGGDYRPETLDPQEHALLDRFGTRIRILPFVRGLSTTALLEKLKSL
jgi:rfaE bifunctional protein nucleotidyltransferase chain/domain